MFRGYRYLAWLMIDENVAYASPATVYNIMKKNGLISKWNKSGEEHEKGFKQPEKPNEVSTECDAYGFFVCQNRSQVLLFFSGSGRLLPKNPCMGFIR